MKGSAYWQHTVGAHDSHLWKSGEKRSGPRFCFYERGIKDLLCKLKTYFVKDFKSPHLGSNRRRSRNGSGPTNRGADLWAFVLVPLD